jgi:hypothetical protein
MLRHAKSEPGEDAGSVRIGKYGRDLPGWDGGRSLATLCSRPEREMILGMGHY